MQQTGTKTLALGLTLTMGCSPLAKAESTAALDDHKEQAIRNAEYLMRTLHGVWPEFVPGVIAKIANNTFRRKSPNQPVWIIDSNTGTILYYQGQPTYTGQPAAQLVDDNGIRFGSQAIDTGSRFHSGWVKLTLGGNYYHAYCSAEFPLIVCSLAV